MLVSSSSCWDLPCPPAPVLHPSTLFSLTDSFSSLVVRPLSFSCFALLAWMALVVMALIFSLSLSLLRLLPPRRPGLGHPSFPQLETALDPCPLLFLAGVYGTVFVPDEMLLLLMCIAAVA